MQHPPVKTTAKLVDVCDFYTLTVHVVSPGLQIKPSHQMLFVSFIDSLPHNPED